MRGELPASKYIKATPTMRCKQERCVSGMKRTGWVTWSSRVWKKVDSLAMELLCDDLAENRGGSQCWITLLKTAYVIHSE